MILGGQFIFIYCSMNNNNNNNNGRRREKKASFVQFTEDDQIDDFSPSKYADERRPSHMCNSNSNRPRSSPPSGRRGNRDERESISQRGFNNFVLNNNNNSNIGNDNSKMSLDM